MTRLAQTLTAGQRVSVTQQIPNQRGGMTIKVEGEVVRAEQKKTGSWYAHAKDDKLWLDRLVIRKTDGEIITLVLDQYTHIEILSEPKAQVTDDAAEGEQADTNEETA